MANNRYYLKCPVCSDQFYFGKSLGNGLYLRSNYEEHLQETYDWIWEHLTDCHRDEMAHDTLFTIESEYQTKEKTNENMSRRLL